MQKGALILPQHPRARHSSQYLLFQEVQQQEYTGERTGCCEYGSKKSNGIQLYGGRTRQARGGRHTRPYQWEHRHKAQHPVCTKKVLPTCCRSSNRYCCKLAFCLHLVVWCPFCRHSSLSPCVEQHTFLTHHTHKMKSPETAARRLKKCPCGLPRVRRHNA